MRFSPGARVGSFEILTQVGVGGMGEVYRARDTRLDRSVALKFLTGPDRPSPDRLERFRREARAISRVNHPHIAAIYDLGEENGTTFLVMEYVAGPTLADRLARGPFGLQEALDFGVQIADALDAAHRQGIVHRDLKPENVIVTRDGVKLLDFGLAKLRASDGDARELRTTATVPLSQEGLVVGTLPYMAPEQLEGKAVDARADLFSLGAMLYEMISGKRPFSGDSKASLIAAILTKEPTPLTARVPLTPVVVDRTVQRCLAKDPDARWQTARDLSAELTWALETIREPPAEPAKKRRAAVSIAAAGTAFAIAAAAVAAAFLFTRRPPTSLPSFHPLTFRRGVILSARFAPDGQTIVYSAAWDGGRYELYLTRLDSKESRPLGISDARLAGISSSGELAFLRGRHSVFRSLATLTRVPLTGEAPRELLDDVVAADWSADGSELAAARFLPGEPWRTRIEFPIGAQVYESNTHIGSLRVSPKGDRIAFLEGNVPNDVVTVDRSGRKTRLSAEWNPAFGLAWSPDGSEVWFTGSRGDTAPALRAVSLAGKERLLAQGPDLLHLEDVSRAGQVLVVRHTGHEGFACRAPGETNERDLSLFDGSSLEALSDDGRTVVFGEIRGGGGPKQGIYLRRTDGSPAIRLADGYPEDISPDGRWVLARPGAAPGSAEKGWVLLPVGAGASRALPLGTRFGLTEANFLPGGQGVAFGGIEVGQGSRIYVQDLSGGPPRPISPEGVRTDGIATPDGRFVEGSIGGHHFLYPVDSGPPRSLEFLSADESLRQWSPDGRAAFVLHAEPWPDTYADIYSVSELIVDKVEIATGHRTAWMKIRPSDPIGLDGINEFYITPNGDAYCYGYLREISNLFLVDGVK